MNEQIIEIDEDGIVHGPPRELKRWETARVCGLLEAVIQERTTGIGTPTRPIGDPADIVAYKAAIAILYANTEME